MNFRQLEQYYTLVDLIQRYEIMLHQIDNGLSAIRYDETRGKTNGGSRITERQALNKEAEMKKLIRLKTLADQRRPEVENTIRDLMKKAGKNKIKIGLILKMRYISAHSWSEISEVTGLKPKDVEKLVITAVKR